MKSLMTSFVVLSALIAMAALAQQKPELPNKNAPAEPPAMQSRQSLPNGQGTIKMPKVSFVSPKDGATVSQEFKAQFTVEGMKVANAGDMTPGTGHFHVIIDSPVVSGEQVIPTDEQHVHFGHAQTEGTFKLKPGPHTLTLEFADGAHRAYKPVVSQTIKITVK